MIMGYLLFKKNKKISPSKMSIIFGLIHILFVLFFSIFVYLLSQSNPEAGWAWLLFAIFDLPMILIFKYLKLLEKILEPFILYGIFGTLQYMLVGYALGLFLKKRLNKKNLTSQSSGPKTPPD